MPSVNCLPIPSLTNPFSNTVIIMTSNVGSDDLGTVRGTAAIPNAVKDQVMLKFRARGFPPEFLNRLDDVVMFVSNQLDCRAWLTSVQFVVMIRDPSWTGI